MQPLADFSDPCHDRFALHAACYEAGVSQRKIQCLLEARADPNREDEQGISPLAIAMAMNNVRLCAQLITMGANVNDLNREGSPLLHSPAFCVAYRSSNALFPWAPVYMLIFGGDGQFLTLANGDMRCF
jgi:hypothetical protein